MQRRDFATVLAAALATPAVMGARTAEAAERGAPAGGAGLTEHMRSVLTREIDDPRTARTLAPQLYDIGFNWHPETAGLDRFDFVVAYAFGNRPPKSGDPAKTLPEPGPVNEDLADTVARVRAHRNIPVYAQWEIARHLDAKYRMSDVTSIEPVVAEDGTIT